MSGPELLVASGTHVHRHLLPLTKVRETTGWWGTVCLLVSHVRQSVRFFPFLPAPWTVARQAPHSLGFPSKNTGVGCHFLLQGIFLTQGSNPHLLHCEQILYCLSYLGGLSETLQVLKSFLPTRYDTDLQCTSSHISSDLMKWRQTTRSYCIAQWTLLNIRCSSAELVFLFPVTKSSSPLPFEVSCIFTAGGNLSFLTCSQFPCCL